LQERNLDTLYVNEWDLELTQKGRKEERKREKVRRHITGALHTFIRCYKERKGLARSWGMGGGF